MSFELNDDEGTIEIDFINKSIKGKCKAKDIPKQMQKVKDLYDIS